MRIHHVAVAVVASFILAACGQTLSTGDPDAGSEPEPDAESETDGGCATRTWYADCDDDGVAGLGGQTTQACIEPPPSGCGGGWVSTMPVAGADDCDDTRNDIHPGAAEACDGVDNDCDGGTDEDGLSTFYRDADADTFGDPAVNMVTCLPPSGFVSNSSDCDDTRNDVNPNATEICDEIDNDCEGGIDEGVLNTYYFDYDGDGYGNTAFPGQACAPTATYVVLSGDCNDANSGVNPGATEVCDTIDNDCDTSIDENAPYIFYRDVDGDGYGTSASSTYACYAPAGYVANASDCNDVNGAINPSAAEVCFDGADNNCSGVQDEAAECSISCNWSGARWMGHGWDGGNAAYVGAWVSCSAGKVTYMDSFAYNPPGYGPVVPPPSPSGTGDAKVGCNWGNANRWGSQGWDGGNAFTFGVDVSCNGDRVTNMTWENNQLMPTQSPLFQPSGQLGCDWTGAIYLTHGIDGTCSWYTGFHVTCHNSHITNFQVTEGAGCNRQRD